MRTRFATAASALILLCLSGATGTSAQASAPAGWVGPTHIGGTNGLANPVSATAPDGTDIVLWAVSGTASPQNTVKAKIRLPGTTTWVKVPKPVVDKDYAAIGSVVGTKAGDFWVAFLEYDPSLLPEIVLRKLDTSAKKWSKPVRPLLQDGYGHGGPELAITMTGTLVVAGYAKPVAYSNPPHYRVAIGIKYPGKPWKVRFLSPATDHAAGVDLAVSVNGYVAVSWIQGYNLADMTVMAATKAQGPDATWSKTALSTTGDSQRAHVAVGRDGTAAVTWTAPSSSQTAVRIASKPISPDVSLWAEQDLATSITPGIDSYPVVENDGSVDGFWLENTGGDYLLKTRRLSGGSLGATTTLSPLSAHSYFDSVRLLTGDKVVVLYHQFDTSSNNQGLRLLQLASGVAGPTDTLTEAADGSVNSEQLGLDAAYRANIVYTRGDYPATDFVSLGQGALGPVPMTKWVNGAVALAAGLKGEAQVGKVLTCLPRYWVEAQSLGFHWYRGTHRIRGETGRRYTLRLVDRGHKVWCRVVASDSNSLRSVLSSPKVRVS